MRARAGFIICGMVPWKKNFIVVWFSQFLSIMGFSFAMPFAPFFMQELGVTDPAKLKMWVALFAAAAPVTLASRAPVWGLLADRYGRRIMLLRANFAAAVVVALMGTVHSAAALVGLRLLQGIFTGTVAAAQTMVSVHAPPHRRGFVLGALSGAVYSGGMTGAFVGGIYADWFGYRAAFYAAGVLLFLAGLLVLVGTREKFIRPDELGPMDPQPERMPREARTIVLPVLLVITAIAFVRTFDSAFLPLLAQEIHGSISGASIWTGMLNAVGGIAGLLAAPLLGRLADRMPAPRLGKAAALGAGILMIPQGLAHGFPLLMSARFGTYFCTGGLDPVFQLWLSRITPEKRRGLVFGWSNTASAIGWIISPLISGGIAAQCGIRAVFFTGAGFFLLLIPLISMVVRKVNAKEPAGHRGPAHKAGGNAAGRNPPGTEARPTRRAQIPQGKTRRARRLGVQGVS